MTYDEMIAVIQAHKEGKKIEMNRGGGRDWTEVAMPLFNFSDCDYRVKPEPREFWINVYPEGAVIHYTEKNAKLFLHKSGTTIKVREVLEDFLGAPLK